MSQSKRRLKKKRQKEGLAMMIAATERMNLYDNEVRDAFNANVSGGLSTRTAKDVPARHTSRGRSSRKHRP
jgi:hypothetical protein